MNPTFVAAVLAAVCLPHDVHGHHPVFPSANELEHSLEAEPSQAWYFRRGVNANVSVSYRAGDIMYTLVYIPDCYFANITIVNVTNCTLGTQYIEGNDHIKNKTVGDVYYEPFGETALRLVAVIHPGVESPVNQTCTYTITEPTGKAQFVVVVGSKEEPLVDMIIGLPIILIRISVWLDVYVYGYFLVCLELNVAIILFLTKNNPIDRWYMAPIFAVFLATSVNRGHLMYTMCSPPGWGLMFLVIPIVLGATVALWTPIAPKTFGGYVWKVFVFLLVLATPTRSWIDVLLVLIAFVYELMPSTSPAYSKLS
jgi:hypothetical protein